MQTKFWESFADLLRFGQWDAIGLVVAGSLVLGIVMMLWDIAGKFQVSLAFGYFSV